MKTLFYFCLLSDVENIKTRDVVTI